MRINRTTGYRPADLAKIQRLSMLTEKKAAVLISHSRPSDILLLNRFKLLSGPEKEALLAKVEGIAENKIGNEHDLLGILLEWPGIEQMSGILGANAVGVKERALEGDIRSFVDIKGHKRFHPERSISEYLYFEQNKNTIMAQRQLRAHIQALSPEQLLELSGFVKDEAGIGASGADELFGACKTWFNRNTLAAYLHLDFNTIQKLITSRSIRVFKARFNQGNPLVLISPKGIAQIQAEIRALLDEAQRWYKNNYYDEIELNSLDDLYTWATYNDLIQIFPFVGIQTFWRMGGLMLFRAKVMHLVPDQYFCSPVRVEWLKEKAVSWLKNEKAFALLKKYGLVHVDANQNSLDYETAKVIITHIMQNWLTVKAVADKFGCTKRAVRLMASSGRIEAIKLYLFSPAGYYFIPFGISALAGPLLEDIEEEQALDEAGPRLELSRTKKDRDEVEMILGVAGITREKDPFGNLGKLLTKEEESKLHCLFKEKKNGFAFDCLINFNSHFIGMKVDEFINKHRGFADEKEDLYGEAVAGFIRGIIGFEPEKGYRLISYAINWIKAYLNEYRDRYYRKIRLPGNIKRGFKTLSAGEKAYKKKHGQLPATYKEIIAFDPEFGLSEKQYAALLVIKGERFVCLDDPLGDEKDATRHENISKGNADNPAFALESAESPIKLVDALSDAFQIMLEEPDLRQSKRLQRNLVILGLRIGFDWEKKKIVPALNLREIGEMYEVSKERIRQLEMLYLPVLKEILEILGVSPDYFNYESDNE